MVEVVSREPNKLEAGGSNPSPTTAPIQGQATSCHELEIERSKGEVAATPDLSKIFAPIKSREFYTLCFFYGIRNKRGSLWNI